MSIQANKDLVRSHLDLSWNKREIEALDEVWATGAVLHLPGGQDLRGSGVIKQYLKSAVGAYTGRDLVIDGIVGEGDTVATRWTFRGVQVGETLGVPPSNQQTTITGMDFYRVSDGKIVEEWFHTNLPARQSGAVK